MTWIRLEDSFAQHPKVMALGKDRLAGLGLWHVAASYTARYLTDGFVPESAIASEAPRRLRERMVEVGLFIACAGGYRLHDWLDYNPSKQSVLANRKAAQTRMEKVRAGVVHANRMRTENEPPANLAQPRTRIPVPVTEVLRSIGNGGGVGEDFEEPQQLYQSRARRKTLSQRERDWIEDLHARFSRREVVSALRIVEPGRDYLKRIDAYLEGGGLDRLG